jgi:8-oxo-dGTP pyrophosphatase MutT (NUDIX family)
MVMRPDGSATPPRPSASVLVVGAGQPWRVLMMRRPRGAEFAPNAYVFPGGTVHTAEDGGFDDEIRAAAVRELFEEMGVLLARRSDGRFAADRECLGLAAALDAGRGWADALAQARLAPAFDRLVPLTRWITPEGFPRRYDTRFFVARNPAAQTVRPRPGEVAEW